MSKKVLMLCYYFTPSNTGGTNRSKNFFRYLPQFGWEPYVITTDVYGKSHLKDVIHTPEIISLVHRLRSQKPSNSNPARSPSSTKSPSRLKSLLIDFLFTWIFIPDRQITWMIFSLIQAIRLIRNQQIDVIFATSPPNSVHIFGLLLKQLTHKPLILDLRDPWSFEAINPYTMRYRWRHRLEQFIERRCFSAANTIILNTPAAQQRYEQIYPDFASRMVTITNGYNKEDIQRASSTVSEAQIVSDLPSHLFVMSHVGQFTRSIDPNYDPTPKALLLAIKQLHEEGILTSANFRAIFAGNVQASITKLIIDYHLESLIHCPGQINHDDALRLIMRSDLVCVYDAPQDGQSYVRGKLYEYLASLHPILAIIPEGAMYDLLSNWHCAFIAHPDDTSKIKSHLKHIIQQQDCDTSDNVDRLVLYEYEDLARQCAEVLDDQLGNMSIKHVTE